MNVLIGALLLLGVVFMVIDAFERGKTTIKFNSLAWAAWGLAFTILHWPK